MPDDGISSASTPSAANALKKPLRTSRSKGRPKGLWDEAFDEAVKISGSTEPNDTAQQLSNVLKGEFSSEIEDGSIHSPSSPELKICSDILQVAIKQEAKSKEEKWHLPGIGDINIANVFGQIASSVQKFVTVGDLLSQLDPIHVGLPWAGVRVILMLSAQSYAKNLVVVQGLASISTIIFRYTVFEEYYLRGSNPVQGRSRVGLEKALKDLYTTALLFLLKAHKHLAQDSAARFLQAPISIDDLANLSQDIAKHEAEVQRYELLELKKTANTQYLMIRELLGAYHDHLQEEQRENILNWISTIDYRSHHVDLHNRLLEGTGQWLFDKKEFVQWKQSSASSLLWLRGDAGTGKSTLVSSVVSRLEGEPRLSSREAFAYFYCSRTSGHSERGDPAEILRSIVLQMSCPFRGLPIKTPIVNKYRTEKALGSQRALFSIKESQDLIFELVKWHYDHVTILIDALDEVDNMARSKLLVFLTKLVQPQETTVKILVSSRNEPDIFDHLGRSDNLYINANDNAADIKLYVEGQIESRLLLGKAGKEIKERVKDKLNTKAQGMFRWVKLQVDSLCDPEYIHFPEDIDEALEKLPDTLDGIYSSTLAKFAQYGNIARITVDALLKFLMVCERTLSISEMIGAISTLHNTRSQALGAMDLVKISRSFVVINVESQIFRFAHLSVKEFLEQRQEYAGESAHSLAAESCLIDQLGRKSTKPNQSNEIGNPFGRYAFRFWARHCQKAAARRQEGKLQELISKFLGVHGDQSAFERWNHASRLATGEGLHEKLFWEIQTSVNFPIQPLFVVCTYGFFELIEPLTPSGLDLLDIKTSSGLNCLGIAARHGQVDAVQVLLRLIGNSEALQTWSNAILRSAAQGGIAVMKFFVDKLRPATIKDKTIVSAAQSESCSEAMVHFLLDRFQSYEVTEDVIGEVAQRTKSAGALELLLKKAPVSITEKILKQGAENDSICSQVMEMLLKHMDPREGIITEDVIIRAVSNIFTSDCFDTVSVLLSSPWCCPISSYIVQVAAGHFNNGLDLFRFLLARTSGFDITEETLINATGNEGSGKDIVTLLLESYPKTKITECVLMSTLQNRVFGLPIMQMLLAHRPDIKITEEIFCLAVGWWGVQDGVIKLLQQHSPDLEITEAAFRAAADDGDLGSMKILLAQPRAFPIGKEIVRLAAGNTHHGTEIITLLLRHAPNVGPFEGLIESAAGNRTNGDMILQTLIDRFGSISVSPNILKAGAKWLSRSRPVLEILFEQDSSAEVTTEVLVAAAGNDFDTIQLLSQRTGPFKLTDEMIKAAMGRYGDTDVNIVKLLLDQDSEYMVSETTMEIVASDGNDAAIDIALARFGTREISSRIYVAAASNIYHGSIVIARLPTKGELNVTKELIRVAAKNNREGLDVLNFFIATSEKKIIFDEEDLELAAANEDQAQDMLEFMFRHSKTSDVTLGMLKAGLRNRGLGRSVTALLLTRLDQITLSEDILEAVVANDSYGKELLSMLLEKSGSSQNIDITETVLKAAAKIECRDDYLWFKMKSAWRIGSMMKILLANLTARVTEEVVRIAAANKTCGRLLTELLIEHSTNATKITSSIAEAAVGNMTFGGSLIRFFLSQPGPFPINQEVLSAAFQNTGYGKEILSLLLEAAVETQEEAIPELINSIKSEPHGLRDALFNAAYRGKLPAVQVLFKNGAGLQEQAEGIGSVLHVAAFRGQYEVVQHLLKQGANANAPGGPHGNSLLAACHQADEKVGLCLIEAGAKIETPDLMGRTALHRCLRAK